MKESFATVQQTLRADKGLFSTISAALAILFLCAWAGWATFARLGRYEVSDSARLEVDVAAYPVQANASGRLATSYLRMGAEVKEGDILLEFDSERERLALQEEKTHLATLAPQLAAIRAELAAQKDGRADERAVLRVSQPGAQAQLEQALAEASLADQEWRRAERLRAEKLISEADAARAKTAAASKRAAAENLQAMAQRLEPELKIRDRDRQIKLEETQLNATKIEAEMATVAATIRKLEYELEKRQLRAAVSGRLAECAPLRPGSHVNEGDRIGVILPSGKLQVVAQFQPPAAFGRIRPGQPAILRLQGFPWAQYGTVQTRVLRVADEIRDGKVRVELAMDQQLPVRIPAQHGLPGSVEVEIERISPAILILRSAGEMVGAH